MLGWQKKCQFFISIIVDLELKSVFGKLKNEKKFPLAKLCDNGLCLDFIIVWNMWWHYIILGIREWFHMSLADNWFYYLMEFYNKKEIDGLFKSQGTWHALRYLDGKKVKNKFAIRQAMWQTISPWKPPINLSSYATLRKVRFLRILKQFFTMMNEEY